MRIPEKYQALYFFLQNIEERLVELDIRAGKLEEGKAKYEIDNYGIDLVRQVSFYLEQLHEFGPYNDMFYIFGQSEEEIKQNVTKRLLKLETMIKAKEEEPQNERSK